MTSMTFTDPQIIIQFDLLYRFSFEIFFSLGIFIFLIYFTFISTFSDKKPQMSPKGIKSFSAFIKNEENQKKEENKENIFINGKKKSKRNEFSN
jgi:hypothetical protein